MARKEVHGSPPTELGCVMEPQPAGLVGNCEEKLLMNLKESFEDGGQKPVPVKMFFDVFYRLSLFI